MGQFRFCYFTPKYDETVAFYRDGLELALLESWDRNPDDRGSLFQASGGIIEVVHRPTGPSSHHWDDRPPQGAMMVIEADDVADEYGRATNKHLPIVEPLKEQSWGHRSFCVREPNGLVLYIFSELSRPLT